MTRTIEYNHYLFDHWTEAQQQHPVFWATLERDFPELPPEQKARVLSLCIGTCHACYNSESNCQCWNDE